MLVTALSLHAMRHVLFTRHASCVVTKLTNAMCHVYACMYVDLEAGNEDMRLTQLGFAH